MGDKAGANDLKLIRRRVECCSTISLVPVEARGEEANKLELRPQPPFCCLSICRNERKHFNFTKTAAVALMFLTTLLFLGEMLEFLL